MRIQSALQGIDPEHLLLGLIPEGDALAARVLVELGADLEHTRREVGAMKGETCGAS